jgi:hypothetical protein
MTAFGYNQIMTKDRTPEEIPPLKEIGAAAVSCPDCGGRLRLSFG